MNSMEMNPAAVMFVQRMDQMRNLLEAFDDRNSTVESRLQLVQSMRECFDTMESELEAAEEAPSFSLTQSLLPVRGPDVSVLRYVSVLGCSATQKFNTVDPRLLEGMNNICIICYQEFHAAQGLVNNEFVSVLHPCEHVFHFDCILDWFQHRQRQSCPMCRVLCEGK